MSNSIIEAREAYFENFPVAGFTNPGIIVPGDPDESVRQTEFLRGMIWDMKMYWEQVAILISKPPP